MTKINYLKTKPVGTCKVCDINLWKEHGGNPAPHTFPCGLEGCPFKHVRQEHKAFAISSTGSSLAQITG